MARFIRLTFFHASMLLVLITFCYENFGIKPATTLSEAAALTGENLLSKNIQAYKSFNNAVIAMRECLYIFLIYFYGKKLNEMFQKLMTAR